MSDFTTSLTPMQRRAELLAQMDAIDNDLIEQSGLRTTAAAIEQVNKDLERNARDMAKLDEKRTTLRSEREALIASRDTALYELLEAGVDEKLVGEASGLKSGIAARARLVAERRVTEAQAKPEND